MTHPLNGCRAKLDRAENQLDALGDQLRNIFEGDAYTVGGQFNEVDYSISIVLEEREQFPVIEWGLALGEAVHHIRGSLDHLVYQLVVAQSGRPHTSHQFPIVKKEKDWKSKVVNPPKNKRRGALDFVHRDHIAAIKRFQPYTPTTGKPSLLTLQRFSNTDKHRLIHAAATWLAEAPQIAVRLTFPFPLRSVSHEPPGTPLRKRTEIARVVPGPGINTKSPDREVDVHTDLKLTTVFGEPGEENTRIGVFRECLADAREIVESFAPDLS
jgi:hypothetical protein